jgi:hypothetical protein
MPATSSVCAGQEKTPSLLPFTSPTESDQRLRVCRRDAPWPRRALLPPNPNGRRRFRYAQPYIFFAVAVIGLAVARSFIKSRPAEPPPPLVATLASLPSHPVDPGALPAYLETVLRARGMTVRVVPCKNRTDFYDLYAGERGDDRPLALVQVRPSESAPPTLSVPGDYSVGPYHIVGNPALVGRVRQALPEWGDER